MAEYLSSSAPCGESWTQPFDSAAADYDHSFTNTRLGRWLRESIWEQLASTFCAGDTVLELGCGTGEDAIWMAQKGVSVVATDASACMLDIACRKAIVSNVADRMRFELLDLHSVKRAEWVSAMTFDGVLSNFGALNCLPDRSQLSDVLGNSVRSGGYVALAIMGPLCPWEVLWHLLHLQMRSATRRFRAGAVARVGSRGEVRVWYPSPHRLLAEFSPSFRHVRTVGIGALLPPTYLNHLVEQHPRFFNALEVLESRFKDVFPFNWLNDHYLMILERR